VRLAASVQVPLSPTLREDFLSKELRDAEQEMFPESVET
jgi:hypothetical protein